ncbi:MAG: hypothetical protein HIU91_06905 [Acidobacteria bacterium]|nr:hypothetical protein [Acidobacteriota bacterium]
MKKLGAIVAFFLMCSLIPAAKAQIGIYGMGSIGFLSSVSDGNGANGIFSGGFHAYGGTFGIYDNLAHLGPLAFGGDGRFFIQSSGNNNAYGNKLDGGLAGARAAIYSHLIPFSPYLQGEIGAVNTNYGNQPQNSTSFAYQIQGGLDFTIFPRLDARAEYGAGQTGAVFPGQRQEMQQLGIGLVFRLP